MYVKHDRAEWRGIWHVTDHSTCLIVRLRYHWMTSIPVPVGYPDQVAPEIAPSVTFRYKNNNSPNLTDSGAIHAQSCTCQKESLFTHA
jgi:hypothetical protein